MPKEKKSNAEKSSPVSSTEKKKGFGMGLIVTIIILVLLLLITIAAGAYYMNRLSDQVKDAENEIEQLKSEKDDLKNKSESLIDEIEEKINDAEDEDVKEEEKTDDNKVNDNSDKNSSNNIISQNDLDKYMNDPNYDYVVLRDENKTAFFTPPANFILTDSTGNVSRNYGKIGGAQGLLIYTDRLNKNTLEGHYQKGMSKEELLESLNTGYSTIGEIITLEEINNLRSGEAVKVITTSSVEEGLRLTYFWIIGGEYLSFTFSGMPSDLEEFEGLADEVAKSVVVVDVIK